MEMQNENHPKVILLGIADDDPRHTTPMSRETKPDGSTKRNTFACINCHSMKQRCIPLYEDDIYRHPCVRCSKLNKICQFDLSKRRRKKRKPNARVVPDGSGVSGSDRDSNTEDSLSGNAFSPNFNGVQFPRNVGMTNERALNLPSNIFGGLDSNFNIQDNTRAKNNTINTSTGVQSAQQGTWQYPNPLLGSTLNQPQRFLPRPWIEAELKRLEGSGRSPLKTPLSAETSVSLEQNAIPVDLASNSSFVTNESSTANNPNMNDNSNRIFASNGTSLSELDTNQLTNQTSSNIILNNYSYNEYELEITNLLSWQKGALETTLAKITTLSDAWDEIVQTGSSVPLYTDPLALGLVTQQDAEYRLKLYREVLGKKFHLPLVKLPDDISVDQLRRSQPILFSTVLSVVSQILPSTYRSATDNMKLDNFTFSLICHYAIKLGQRNIELIKSLLILCLWYNFAEWTHKTRYHFFNYICCSTIRDLELSSASKPSDVVSHRQYVVQPTDIEHDDDFFRTVLMIYVSGLNISIFLRQPVQLRWSCRFDAFCQDILKGNYPSKIYSHEDDKVFVHFSKINHCLESIHTNIQITTGAGIVEMASKYTTFDNTKFVELMKKELDELYPLIPRNRHRIIAFYHSVYAYLYESILIHFFQSKTAEDKFELTHLPHDIELAFKCCAQECFASFEHFLKLTPELIASMPLFHISRIIYIFGVLLLKLRFGVMTIPALSQFSSLMEPCIDTIRRICELLDRSSTLFPHNSFLIKLRYLCALFSQTYATKLRKYLQSHNSAATLNPNSQIQSTDVSSFFVDSMVLENSINSLNDQFWTDMLTNLL